MFCMSIVITTCCIHSLSLTCIDHAYVESFMSRGLFIFKQVFGRISFSCIFCWSLNVGSYIFLYVCKAFFSSLNLFLYFSVNQCNTDIQRGDSKAIKQEQELQFTTRINAYQHSRFDDVLKLH